jgi:hypothetical protein
MDRNFRKTDADGTGASPPSDAWLFAQALLGKAVPSGSRAEADAQAKRAHLEWLAQISPSHAEQFRKLQCPEAEARHQRQLLEWLARISPEHEAKLRTLLREEAEAQEAQDRCERFNEAYFARVAEWNEVDHPRRGYGSHPGAWVDKGDAGGSSGASSNLDGAGTDGKPQVVDKRNAPPGMLELANAWWQTNNLLQQARRDIVRLPKLIADEEAQLRKGGLNALIHLQQLAKAKQELETAKELVRQLPG